MAGTFTFKVRARLQTAAFCKPMTCIEYAGRKSQNPHLAYCRTSLNIVGFGAVAESVTSDYGFADAIEFVAAYAIHTCVAA